MNVTVCPLLGGKTAVCHTRDVSEVGICLDTSDLSEWIPVGTRVSLALVDPRSGTAMEVIGDVVREAFRSELPTVVDVMADPAEITGLRKDAVVPRGKTKAA